jgi:hypothetical protein
LADPKGFWFGRLIQPSIRKHVPRGGAAGVPSTAPRRPSSRRATRVRRHSIRLSRKGRGDLDPAQQHRRR